MVNTTALSCYWSTSVHMLSFTNSLNLLNFFNLLNFLNFPSLLFMNRASFYYFSSTRNTQCSLKNDNSRWIVERNFIRKLDTIWRKSCVDWTLTKEQSTQRSFCLQGKYLLFSEREAALIDNIGFFKHLYSNWILLAPKAFKSKWIGNDLSEIWGKGPASSVRLKASN